MASSISTTATTPPTSKQSLAYAPKVLRTLATKTAPKGRIVEDFARGSCFWEAETSGEGEPALQEVDSDEDAPIADGFNSFAIEWISTTKLPFHRTRGLRNPWNSNREVKIARDGTELEPTVGRRLLHMFDGVAPNRTWRNTSGSSSNESE